MGMGLKGGRENRVWSVVCIGSKVQPAVTSTGPYAIGRQRAMVE